MKTTPVDTTYLCRGAVFALEQCGYLLQDAALVYCDGSYATAVVLAAFAREELGRACILFDLREKVLAGEVVTKEAIRQACDDHELKQKSSGASVQMSTTKDTGLGKLLQLRFESPLHSAERKELDDEVRALDKKLANRAPSDRHQRRMRALFVEPDIHGSGWNRPRDLSQKEAHEFVTHASNDYAVGLQRVEPGQLIGYDDRLLGELTRWTDRPPPPLPVQLPLPS